MSAVRQSSELHDAARQGTCDAVKRLLHEGADPNAKDRDGFTPLHYAASEGHIETVRFLLERGADESSTNSSGKSARDLANDTGHANVSALLVDSPIHDAASILKQEQDRKQNRQAPPLVEERYKEVCEGFDARVEIHSAGGENRIWSYRSIYDLLYSQEDDEWAAIQQRSRDDMKDKTAGPKHAAMRWVHLPANNIIWVKDLIKRICYSDHKSMEQCDSILKFVDGNLFAHTESDLHACYREPSWHAKEDRLSLALPYLDMESEQYLQRKSNVKPLTKHETRMHYLVEQYNVKSDMYISRTLDQAYYLGVENTDLRDHDQIVSQNTREMTPGGFRILMVNQLWVWMIDENTIITSCAQRWHEGAEITMLSAILRDRPPVISHALDWVSHIVNRCVSFSEAPSNAGLGEQYMDTFAKAVGSVYNREADSDARLLVAMSTGSVNHLRLEEDMQLLPEIKNIRIELYMLGRILDDQIDVISRALQWVRFSHRPDDERILGLLVARSKQIERMVKDVEDVEKALYRRLDLKQKYSNIVNAKQASIQAQSATAQGKFVFVFTIVTVIFTPLSFMAALFAIQVKQFPHDETGLSFDGGWIGKYMVAGEVTTFGAVAFIVLAFVFFRHWREDKKLLKEWNRERAAQASAIRARAMPSPAEKREFQISDSGQNSISSTRSRVADAVADTDISVGLPPRASTNALVEKRVDRQRRSSMSNV